MTILQDPSVSYVFVDGMNLFLRCHHAPGMRALSDRRGRKTGALYGFLRSIGVLRRRFPQAEITIAWEGSTAHRKAIFPTYKRSRGLAIEKITDVWGEVAWLRAALPSAGIRQAWHPEWEADDTIASLVKQARNGSPLKVIVSSDRDFWTLVNLQTSVLLPEDLARGKLWGPTGVQAEWLVWPDELPILRALLGDKSDDLPGIVRVPKKFLASLVGATSRFHLAAIFSLAERSNLWTKHRRAALLAHKAQAYVNLAVMRLQDELEVFYWTQKEQYKNEAIFRNALAGVDIEPEAMVAMFFGLTEEPCAQMPLW